MRLHHIYTHYAVSLLCRQAGLHVLLHFCELQNSESPWLFAMLFIKNTIRLHVDYLKFFAFRLFIKLFCYFRLIMTERRIHTISCHI
jgi:hypothetical protein